MSLWVTLPAGFDAGELLIHARERGILFVPGKILLWHVPQPKHYCASVFLAGLDEKSIARGIHVLCDLLKEELRKRQRGAREEYRSRVALI